MYKEIQGHHSWRQAQTLSNVKGFREGTTDILHPTINNYAISGQIPNDNLYRYEFPLYQYILSKIEQIMRSSHASIARIYTFIIACLGVLGMYFLCLEFTRNKVASFLAASFFLNLPVFFFYSVNPLPDIMALSTTIWYLVFMIRYIKSSEKKHLYIALVFLLVSSLCKLQYGMFGIVSLAYSINLIRLARFKELLHIIMIHLGILLPSLLWYATVVPTWVDQGNPVVTNLTSNFTADTWDLAVYHMETTFPRFLMNYTVWIPAIIGVIALFFFKVKYRVYLISLIVITTIFLIIELNALGKWHEYYLFVFYPWIGLLIAIGLNYILELNKGLVTIIFLVLCLWNPFVSGKVYASLRYEEATYIDMDFYRFQEQLQKAVSSDEKVIILDDFSPYITLYLLDKYGYTFNSPIPINEIKELTMSYCVGYLYSSNRKIEDQPEFSQIIDSKIAQYGNIKIFKLKVEQNCIPINE